MNCVECSSDALHKVSTDIGLITIPRSSRPLANRGSDAHRDEGTHLLPGGMSLTWMTSLASPTYLMWNTGRKPVLEWVTVTEHKPITLGERQPWYSLATRSCSVTSPVLRMPIRLGLSCCFACGNYPMHHITSLFFAVRSTCVPELTIRRQISASKPDPDLRR